VISLTRLLAIHPAPPAKAVRRAVVVVAAALPIVVAAAFASGTTGAVWSVLGLLAGISARAVLDTARSAVVAVAIAGFAAAATAASGPALAAGLIVAAAAAAAGLADRWSAGVATLAPISAAVAGSWPGLTWPVAGGWLLAGGLYGIAAVALLKVHLHRRPLDARRAAVHAASLAVLCGTAAGLAAAFRLPHGYWIVLTLVVTLRPVVEESARKAVNRVTGTLLGVLIPIPLIYFLPSAALAAIVALSVLAFVSYMLAGEYIRQTAFMTLTIVIVASGGMRANAVAVGEIRLAWTLVGTAAAAATAAVLWHVERDWPL
jgi:hypothetical protein